MVGRIKGKIKRGIYGLISIGLVLLTFLLCSLVSVLTGTSFGTAATIGVICMSIANSVNYPVFWVGGAILSGAFFGDRCSPVSTSALLVANMTDTDIYQNIKGMVKTAAVPFMVTCLIYLVVGLQIKAEPMSVLVTDLFPKEIMLHPICLLPAACVLLLACFQVNVKKTMASSIVIASALVLFYQKMPVGRFVKTLIWGYQASGQGADTPQLLDGGGITSMIRVGMIVCIASCYSGIFQETGLLDFMKRLIHNLSTRLGNFTAVLIISILTVMMSCNQSLAILLTSQLAKDMKESKETIALYLEDSVVVVAALVPWSIAGNVPLATVGAPILCMLGACFLYILPMWRIVIDLYSNKKNKNYIC